MTVDTQVRHVTKAGSNIFRELGFPAAQARRLQQASRQEIDGVRRLKTHLMDEIAAWIAAHELTQQQAAGVLLVSRPRVSDLVNGKADKFTIDALVAMAGLLGKRVTIAVK
jgi:predicted XRE-type DNA-binding protein